MRRTSAAACIVALNLFFVPAVPTTWAQGQTFPVGRMDGSADTVTAGALSSAFRSAAERAMPAVVFIAVAQSSMAPRQDQLDRLPEPFRDFFRSPDSERPRDGTGSGFIIDAEGHILTNTHVVAEAASLTVRLMDGREYAAHVVGSDISTDIAVIRIEPRPGEVLPLASLGDSDQVRVGDWVLALGNPLGLDFTVTAGIVSAQGRQISNGGLESYIQTDAAINPGNSGGPLIDLFGRVIGINSAIFGSNRFVGYGFAVPINIARRVVDDLREFGYLRRPMLGVEVRSVLAVDAELYDLSEVRGAFVSTVTPGAPAAVAGVRPGDIIVSLDDHRIRDDTHLITTLAGLRPGQTVTVGILRDGKARNLNIRLGEFDRPEPRPPRPAPPPEAAEQILGFTVRDLSRDDAASRGYSGSGGVAVDRVIQYGGAWATNQIRPGTIVLAINGRRVNAAGQVTDIARGLRPGAPVSVIVFDAAVGAERVVNYRTRQ